MQTLRSSVLAEGIVFGEGPRWHDGRLWFADVHGNAVKSVDADGTVRVEVETEHPSGLGWLPGGTLLISTLLAPTLLRVDDGQASVVEDFGDRGWSLNDMVVGPDGRAYVDLYVGDRGVRTPQGEILLVTPDGATRSVASDLVTPNGLAITPDRSALRVNETFMGRVLSYDIAPDGSLSGRRVFADLGPDRQPDGLCLDAEGAVWVASLTSGEFLRVRDGGAITHRIEAPGRWAVAPALGGPDRRTLFLVVNETSMEGLARGASRGRIETVRVDVPGAGWP
jgi:sugar lactone lactonase YvrE